MSMTLQQGAPGEHHKVSIETHRVQLTDAVRLTGLSPTTIRRYVDRGKHGFSVDKSELPHTYLIPASFAALETPRPVAIGHQSGLQVVPTDGGTADPSIERIAGGAPGGESVRSALDTMGLQIGTQLETLRDEVISDLKQQVEQHQGENVHLRDRLASREQELRDTVSAHREELLRSQEEWRARVTELGEAAADREANIAARDCRISELTGQVSALEAKVREVLEEGKSDSHQLANRIADLVQQHAAIQTRVLELEPVAAEVPMLQAAVEDTKAELTQREKKLFDRERQLADLSEDIETIASRPVTGPVFRLLTKGKLRV